MISAASWMDADEEGAGVMTVTSVRADVTRHLEESPAAFLIFNVFHVPVSMPRILYVWATLVILRCD